MRTFDPWRDLESLRQDIDRAFATMLSGVNDGFFPTAFLPGRSARAYPLLNVSEDKDNLYIQALAPGIAPESIHVTIQQNNLTLSGEKPAPQNVKVEAFHRNERAAGTFTRSIELPVEVDSNRIEARYQDGLLALTLPKREEAKPRQVAVTIQ